MVEDPPPTASGQEVSGDNAGENTQQAARNRDQASTGQTEELPPLDNMANNLPNAALLEQIEAMINRAITAQMATPQPINQPADQPRDADQTQWYAADLGFFDPTYDGKTVTTREAMEHAGKDTIF